MNNPSIIFEDNHLLIVEKPKNMPVQEDSSNDEDLLTYLKKYIKEKNNKPGNVFLGLIHRLDRPVGGVMVFAKTSKAASRLSEQIRIRSVKKTYIAKVYGKPKKEKARLENYLYKDTQKNRVHIVGKNEKKAKLAILSYEVIKVDGNESILEVKLETGRSHQIRVQLSNISCPIVGDRKYGYKSGKQKTTDNIYLWSYKLSIKHPVTKEVLEFISKPPWL